MSVIEQERARAIAAYHVLREQGMIGVERPRGVWSGDHDPIEPFGPDYNIDSPALRRARRSARAGLASLDRAERQAYGAAVEAAVLASQRAHVRRNAPAFRANCTSGTFHNDGRAIHEAMRARLRAEAEAFAAKVRRDRSPRVWREMYETAMAEKRKREMAGPHALILVGRRDLDARPAKRGRS